MEPFFLQTKKDPGQLEKKSAVLIQELINVPLHGLVRWPEAIIQLIGLEMGPRKKVDAAAIRAVRRQGEG